MMERCHRTIEDCIKKVMVNQTDWYTLLNSVLFSIRCPTHSSTRYSPFHMLYNKDPILPFQYGDQSENCPYIENNSDGWDVDPVMEMVAHLEAQHTAIFEKAG